MHHVLVGCHYLIIILALSLVTVEPSLHHNLSHGRGLCPGMLAIRAEIGGGNDLSVANTLCVIGAMRKYWPKMKKDKGCSFLYQK